MLPLIFLDCQVKVGDRTAVVTANAETVAVKPPGIQEAINVETGKCTSLSLEFLKLKFCVIIFAY